MYPTLKMLHIMYPDLYPSNLCPHCEEIASLEHSGSAPNSLIYRTSPLPDGRRQSAARPWHVSSGLSTKPARRLRSLASQFPRGSCPQHSDLCFGGPNKSLSNPIQSTLHSKRSLSGVFPFTNRPSLETLPSLEKILGVSSRFPRKRSSYLESSLEPSIMADHASFVDYVPRVDELFGDVEDCVSIPRQQLRDRLNPMEHFTDSEFLARYRFTKSSVKKLLECLPFEESCSNCGHPLPPVMQLLITLRFYGAGTFQVVMSDLVNVSQPTVSRVIERVSRLIAKHLFPAVGNFPNPDDRCRETMVEFYRIAEFPGVTGCIDCTHVRIISPGGPNGEVYRNRKGYFSINVQVTCSFFAANVESIAVLLKCSNST
ncbi:uncharacterized protein LOC119169700 [Rhipicephalus microplus]|uniref:uncharacterized protein LOC119169700 n=1 Tax=Rhipicephalus microplus TaxID=6941 RepID=UPI003F6D3966